MLSMYYIGMFNNREKAIVIWLLIFFVWCLRYGKIRGSVISLFKTFFEKVIIIPIALMLLYIVLIILIFHKMNMWNITLIKDTIIWFLGTAFVLFIDINNANRDEHYFRKIFFDNLKFILIFEFILNFYTLSLSAELILFPFIALVGILNIFADYKKEYKLKKILEYILGIFVLFIFIFTAYNIFKDYKNLATTDNLRIFLLSPALTFSCMPFLYFFALYLAYENIFTRLNIFLKDKALARFAKRKIFLLCLLNLWKLNAFAKENITKFMKLRNHSDVLNMLQEFSCKKDLKGEIDLT